MSAPDRRRFLRVLGRHLALGLAGSALAACDRSAGALRGADEPRIIEQRQTRFGTLAVFEQARVRYLAYLPGARPMRQSVIDLDRPGELTAQYTRLMMLGLVYADPHRRIAQIGVGAGLMAGYVIRNFPSVVVDAIDIDPHAVELGRKHFGLTADPRLRIHIADGRTWLAEAKETFDVVMLDAYDDASIPPALADESFFAIVAARVAATGVAMQNAYLSVVDARRLMAAMRASFAQVDMYRIGSNAVLAAYHGPPRAPDDLMHRAKDIDERWRPVHSLAAALAQRVQGL